MPLRLTRTVPMPRMEMVVLLARGDGGLVGKVDTGFGDASIGGEGGVVREHVGGDATVDDDILAIYCLDEAMSEGATAN